MWLIIAYTHISLREMFNYTVERNNLEESLTMS